jgi:hypothetical protein
MTTIVENINSNLINTDKKSNEISKLSFAEALRLWLNSPNFAELRSKHEDSFPNLNKEGAYEGKHRY